MPWYRIDWLKAHKWGQPVLIGLQAASSVYVVWRYGVFPTWVTGPSMFPTLSGRGELVIAEAVSPALGIIKPGDVVISAKPTNPKEHVIKRVAAVAGDEVTVYPSRDQPSTKLVKVPRGHIWLQGDNLSMSRDSREYGPVPLALVRGRVWLQVWPRLKWLEQRPPVL